MNCRPNNSLTDNDPCFVLFGHFVIMTAAMLLNVTWCVWNKCSAAHCDSVATAFCDTNAASPQTPFTNIHWPEQAQNWRSSPTFFADISTEKTWEAIYCSADLYSLYDWIKYSVSEDSVYWFCTNFGQLILTKIVKITTRCQILRPKCIKFDFGWGFVPDPADRYYSAPPDALAGGEGDLLLPSPRTF